jgi:hypothetical protein
MELHHPFIRQNYLDGSSHGLLNLELELSVPSLDSSPKLLRRSDKMIDMSAYVSNPNEAKIDGDKFHFEEFDEVRTYGQTFATSPIRNTVSE